MAWNLLAQLALSIVVSFVAYLLAPKPKSQSRQGQKLRTPTAEAGIPVKVAFGEITDMSPNVEFYGDLSQRDYEVGS